MIGGDGRDWGHNKLPRAAWCTPFWFRRRRPSPALWYSILLQKSDRCVRSGVFAPRTPIYESAGPENAHTTSCRTCSLWPQQLGPALSARDKMCRTRTRRFVPASQRGFKVFGFIAALVGAAKVSYSASYIARADLFSIFEEYVLWLRLLPHAPHIFHSALNFWLPCGTIWNWHAVLSASNVELRATFMVCN